MENRKLPQDEAGGWAGLYALVIEFEETHEPGDEISQEEADIFIEKAKKIMEQDEKSFPKDETHNNILAKSIMSYLTGRTIKSKELTLISDEQIKKFFSDVSAILTKMDVPLEKHADFCKQWVLELNKHIDFINKLAVNDFNKISKPFFSNEAIKLLGYTEASAGAYQLNEQLHKIPFMINLMNQAMNKILEIAIKKEKMESNFEDQRKDMLDHFSSFMTKPKKEIEVLPDAPHLAM